MIEDIVLELDKGRLQCKADGRVAWSLGLEEIALIGEVRVVCDPDENIWDVILVQLGGKRLESFSANNASAPEILRLLGDRLGGKLELQLREPDGFSSVVMWPPSLKGKAFFVSPPEQKGGIVSWLKEFFSPPKGYYFSEEVNRFVYGADS